MSDRYAQFHEASKLAGPGDARPTATQIIQDQSLEGGLKGKVALVTGVSSGIGLETVRALAKTGATVYGTVRDAAKTQAVLGGSLGSNVHLISMELGSLASIRKAAAEFLAATGGKLNILINNAGIMGTPEGRTEDGFESQLGVNHLGHFLLFELVREALLASASPECPSRVVTVSSVGHRLGNRIHFDNLTLEGEYDPWAAYAQSKLANIYMASEIERRFGAQNLHAWSVHPGGIVTPLYKHVTPEQAASFLIAENERKFKSAEQGAASQVWAAVARELNDGPFGRYIEDCGIVTKIETSQDIMVSGHAPWAYDPEAETRLWEESLKLVGISEQ